MSSSCFYIDQVVVTLNQCNCASSISFTYLSARVGALDSVGLVARGMAADLDLRFRSAGAILLVVARIAYVAGTTGHALVLDCCLARARQLLTTTTTIVVLLKHALLTLIYGHLLVRHGHEALAGARSSCHLMLSLEVLANDRLRYQITLHSCTARLLLVATVRALNEATAAITLQHAA